MIETERLVLRPWRQEDKLPFVALVNTPAMMEHFGGTVPRESVDALVDAQIANQARDGHCFWAVADRAQGTLLGICGLRIGGHPGTQVPRELEIGWRIGQQYWGRGIAREAAEASIAWGWANTDHPRIAAWTSIANTRSWGLMERIGMVRRFELDFAHPHFGAEDPVGAMIVYTLDRPDSGVGR